MTQNGEELRAPTGRDVICEAVGQIIEFWGFKRVMGRIWAQLYLSPRPLSAAEICEALQISAGSASMTLNELQTWGVVRRAVVPGSRVAHYEAETNVWKMISKVFRERESDRLHDLARALRSGARQLLDEGQAGSADAELAAVQARRVERLARLAEQASAVLEALLESPDLDISPLLEALRGTAAGAGPAESPPGGRV